VGLSGTRAALPIWVDFMKAALAGRPATEFPPPPEGIVFVEIDRDTGLLAQPGCPRTRFEVFVAGTEPREPCGIH
jgi:membrane carboxypeptidase/penicillin-binding protein